MGLIFTDGLEKLIDFYHDESVIGSCKLKESCPGGCSPPPLSMSSGTTNYLHKAIKSSDPIHILISMFCFLIKQKSERYLSNILSA